MSITSYDIPPGLLSFDHRTSEPIGIPGIHRTVALPMRLMLKTSGGVGDVVRLSVASAVSVALGTGVAAVALAVCVALLVGDGVVVNGTVGVPVALSVGLGVGVGLGMAVSVTDGAPTVLVPDAAGAAVAVTVALGGVFVTRALAVSVGLFEGRGMAVGLDVAIAVSVAAGMTVAEEVGELVGEAVPVDVELSVGLGVSGAGATNTRPLMPGKPTSVQVYNPVCVKVRVADAPVPMGPTRIAS